MKIGYDAKRAFLNKTGLGNYSRGVIRMMAGTYLENEYFLYTPNTGHDKADFIPHGSQVKVVTPRVPLFSALWRSRFVVNDLKRDGIDLYHGLSHEVPVGIDKSHIKSIVTIHDLIFMRYPRHFTFFDRMLYQSKVEYACEHANHIIAVSERTKLDLIELLEVPENKITVVYQGCDAIFKVKQSIQKKTDIRLKYNLPDEFILYVGTIEERKNLYLLTNAFRSLPRNTNLVVIGKQTAYVVNIMRLLSQYNLDTRVFFLQNVGFADLPAIYQMAQVFVYPSRYEGFGIPVLEALVSGTPVIAATGSCLEEAGGPGSLYNDPDDEIDLAENIRDLLASSDQRNQMAAEGLRYARKFEDAVLAPQLMQLYQTVLNNA